MNEQFLKLVAALTTPYPHNGDPFEEKRFSEFQTALLVALWNMRKHPPALNFLTAINYKDETDQWRLRQAHRLAKELLPVLIREKEKLNSESEMTRFQKRRSATDPFMDGNVCLTQDAYSGEVEPDELDYELDSRGNIVFKRNK